MIKHTQTYERHSVVSIDEALVVIKTSIDSIKARQKPIKALINGVTINVKSLRLQTFLEKGTVCVKCGRIGTHFAVERSTNQEVYHLNLWATDEQGDEYLMTHDHILARSLGGADKIENTQTMCSPCNAEKGQEELKLLLEKQELIEMKTTYKIYYTEDGICKSKTENDLCVALKVAEYLHQRRREGAKITHITMVSENVDMVGEQGVDSIVDGKTPAGLPYDWKKHRAGRFKDADKTKIHIKVDEQI